MEIYRGDVPASARVTMNTTTQPVTLGTPDKQPWVPTLLLMEHRDEVFARLATDLSETGLAVIRTCGAAATKRVRSRRRLGFIVINADLPNLDVWQFAREIQCDIAENCFWVYKSRCTAADVSRARASLVDELIAYGGDVLYLADCLIDCLAGTSPRRSLPSGPPNGNGFFQFFRGVA